MSTLVTPSRRAFLGMLAAPAIVRIDNIMPVKVPKPLLVIDAWRIETVFLAIEPFYFDYISAATDYVDWSTFHAPDRPDPVRLWV